MIVVITYRDKETGRELVSHGVDIETNQTIIMPTYPPQACGAKWDIAMQEWVIESGVECE